MLEVRLAKRLGAFELDAAFQSAGAVTALFGPSGAGKTTLLNMVAGLITPDAGTLTLDGETLFDAVRGVDLPVRRRRLGYVFQEARLFPHLSVRQNLHYGRWMRGFARDTAQEARIVALLALEKLLERRPGALSGGEKQRVAIGRALLAQPRLLLLDEPLSSLDTARKAEVLPYLRALRAEGGTPMLYVSHNRAEVEALADDVVEIAEGRVTAAGPLTPS